MRVILNSKILGSNEIVHKALSSAVKLFINVSNVSITGLREEMLFLKKLANALSFIIVVYELSLY